jgi:leucine dehydrogenase
MFEELIKGWDGEEVVLGFDHPTATWMFIGVHSRVLGPAMGGTRMKAYANVEEALVDVLRLSSAMTLKQAAAGLPYGGGKAVLAISRPPAGPGRRELLVRYADLVASLGGAYVTAADMNTGQRDMDVIFERCPHVLGRSPENGGSGDPGAGTASGVFHGIVSSVRHLFGSDGLEGSTVLVQGVGSVGSRLATLLAEAEARVLVSDTDAERAKRTAKETGATIVAADEVIGTAVDVYAPCAVGGTLSVETIPRLRCRIVAGAANNQLAASGDAHRLRDARVLYAPDYVINAGGVIHLAGFETLGWTQRQVGERIAGIGHTLTEVYRAAETEGITTTAAADRIANARIQAARTRPP